MDFSDADTVSPVAAAAPAICFDSVRRLIQEGLRVDGRDIRGWNLLHMAAAAGSVECVREILTAGSSQGLDHSFVNSLTREGETSCYLAARDGHLAVVRLLLKNNADMNHQTKNVSFPLYAAVKGGHTPVVELLVRYCADVNGIRAEPLWSCLHQAVYLGHCDIVNILVKVSNLEAKDGNDVTPVFLATQCGNKECLKILLNAGADANAQDECLQTPLYIASKEGREEFVDLLLENGADPNRTCNHDLPQLPIDAAARMGHLGILRRLIAVTDRVCDRGEGMISPLYAAIQSAETEAVKLLLSEGFSPDAQDVPDIAGSPLSLAIQRYPSEIPKMLLAAGATLNEGSWSTAFGSFVTHFLSWILEHRCIPGKSSTAMHDGKTVLTTQEMSSMLSVALDDVFSAPRWLPLLLKAGLEPTLMVKPLMLEEAESKVINYLLEFVNWSTLSPSLKNILDLRRADKTWEPFQQYDTIPSLSHMCRLQIRSVLGPDVLMRTDIVKQLPVPSILHDFLQFKDIVDC